MSARAASTCPPALAAGAAGTADGCGGRQRPPPPGLDQPSHPDGRLVLGEVPRRGDGALSRGETASSAATSERASPPGSIATTSPGWPSGSARTEDGRAVRGASGRRRSPRSRARPTRRGLCRMRGRDQDGRDAAPGRDRARGGLPERSLRPGAAASARGLRKARQMTVNTLVQGALALLLQPDRAGRSASAPPSRDARRICRRRDHARAVHQHPARGRRAGPAMTAGAFLRALQDRTSPCARTSTCRCTGCSASPDSRARRCSTPSSCSRTTRSTRPCAPRGTEPRFSGLAAHESANYPLMLTVSAGARLTLQLNAHADRIGEGTATRLLALAARLIQTLADAPRPAREHRPRQERGERPRGGADRGRRRPLPGWRVDRRIAAQAARTPEALALVQGERAWSYAELDARGSALARDLAGLGVARGAGSGSRWRAGRPWSRRCWA